MYFETETRKSYKTILHTLKTITWWNVILCNSTRNYYKVFTKILRKPNKKLESCVNTRIDDHIITYVK